MPLLSRGIQRITVHLHSGWFAVTPPIIRQMCHIKEVGYRLCFPVEHLVAMWDKRERIKTFLTCFFFCFFFPRVAIFANLSSHKEKGHVQDPVFHYHALSLKEIGAVPGGAFRAF